MPDATPQPAREYRPCGRVLLIDGQDRVLMLLVQMPEDEEPRLWITPGGMIAPGESFEQAALRELWEETGIEGVALGPLVWTRRHEFRWGERLIDSDERIFLARVPGVDVEVAPRALEPIEVEELRGHRWWSVPELIAARDQIFAPSRLAELLPPLLAGELPQAPPDVGP